MRSSDVADGYSGTCACMSLLTMRSKTHLNLTSMQDSTEAVPNKEPNTNGHGNVSPPSKGADSAPDCGHETQGVSSTEAAAQEGQSQTTKADGSIKAGIDAAPMAVQASASSGQSVTLEVPSDCSPANAPALPETPIASQNQLAEYPSPDAVDQADIQLSESPACTQGMRTVQEEEEEEGEAGTNLVEQQQQQQQQQLSTSGQASPLQPHPLQPQSPLLPPVPPQQLAQSISEVGTANSLGSAIPSSPGVSPAPSGASALSASLPYPAGSISSMLPPRATASAILTGGGHVWMRALCCRRMCGSVVVHRAACRGHARADQ